MVSNDYLEKILKIGEPFVKRKKKDPSRQRRDGVKPDEVEAMLKCRELRATEEEIAEAFKRDKRTVKHYLTKAAQAMESEEIKAKALDEHIEEVKGLLKNWVKTADNIAHIHKDIDFEYEVEEDPLFMNLMEHCPTINKSWNIFCNKRFEYNQLLLSLEETVRKEEPVEASQNFSSKAARFSIYVALRGDLPIYDMDKNKLLIVQGDDSSCIAVGNAEALKVCQIKHQDLVERFSRSPDVQQIVDTRSELVELEKTLFNSIHNALITKEHANYSCVICRHLF